MGFDDGSYRRDWATRSRVPGCVPMP